MSLSLRSAAVASTMAVILAACSPGSDTVGTPSPPESPTVSPAQSPSVTPPVQIGGAALADVSLREDVVTGLNSPWSIAFLADDSLVVTSRDTGVVSLVSEGSTTPLGGAGAEQLVNWLDSSSEGGLLGIAVHPEHTDLLYVYLTRGNDNAVVRMQLVGTALSAPVEVVTGIPKARNHNGGRIAFGPDGYLYISTGDAAVPQLSQDRDSLAGKILRVTATGDNTDGTAAPGNPFGTLVYSWGHRNVQGFAWVADGRMYASEFGASDRDELNLIVAGSNYGWPEVEGLIGAPQGTQPGDTVGGFTYPVAEWSTSDASPSGVAATHEAIYVAALRGQRLWRVPLTPEGIGQPHVLIDDLGRIRHVAIGPDGALYVVTNNTDGRGSPRGGDDRIVRIEVAANTP